MRGLAFGHWIEFAKVYLALKFCDPCSKMCTTLPTNKFFEFWIYFHLFGSKIWGKISENILPRIRCWMRDLNFKFSMRFIGTETQSLSHSLEVSFFSKSTLNLSDELASVKNLSTKYLISMVKNHWCKLMTANFYVLCT